MHNTLCSFSVPLPPLALIVLVILAVSEAAIFLPSLAQPISYTCFDALNSRCCAQILALTSARLKKCLQRTVECRNSGVQEQWSVGTVECRNSGVQEQWSAGTVECRNSGVQEQWSAGTVECRNSGV
ncbi:hypothetical protein RRG08_059216 [Elysia crispata]|uniref:Uncharacterized protein n=1 Tax=Elysia crispata TaxID=231223 RepID=A0AAE0ZEI2_9GAST|nr:hypothetical protein RRG08_059216 [Elysia crispata]